MYGNYRFEHVSWLCRWENNIGLQEVECEEVDRIQLAQNVGK